MITVAILVILAISLYFYGSRTFKYWEERGVKHDPPVPVFGNNLRGYLFRASKTQLAVEQYWRYPDEKVVGFFRATSPELLIRDPELIKRILITDFSYFYQRGTFPSRTTNFEPLMQNLFLAEGDLWKLLRQRMTPTFTTGKLKAMFPLIVERAERLQARTIALAGRGEALDARELMARYTTDFIGAVAFGLDTDSLNDDDSSFRRLGIEMFKIKYRQIAVVILKEIFPETFRNMKIMTRLENDINELLGEILRQRNYKPSGRNDFIDLMLECKIKGTIVGESIERTKPDGAPDTATVEFDDSLIAAQVFIFFAAGFETSSTATSFTLHQLARHPAAQRRAHEEIDRVLAKHGGQLSYEAIKEMVYLERALKEGMRMFPALGTLTRRCTKSYTVPELNLTIEKGTGVMIPLQALHSDPQYFEDPLAFRPERFDEQEGHATNRIYMPFGAGPRACIGSRLGLMQSLAGLAAVLARCRVEPPGAEPCRLRAHPRCTVVQSVPGGVPLLFRERGTAASS